MKILFYSSYFYPYISGLTTYPYKILTFLSKKNQITILTFNHKDNRLEIESRKNLRIIRMPYLVRVSKGFISTQSIFYFLKEIKNNDLIIVNLPNVEGLFLTILAKLYNKKIISIFHCFIFYKNKLIELITNKITEFQMILSNNIFIYTKDYISQFSIFKKIKNKLIEVLPPVKKTKIDQTFLNKLKKIKNNNIWIGFSGRIAEEKGIEYLIEAIKKINKKNIELIFAGPYGNRVAGENQYFLKIKNHLIKNKITHKFLGNLNENQLASFYKLIDLLVLPSINHTEAFGMVQAEAMLFGTPVIATNLPGVRIPIKLTKMGVIIEPKNSEQLKRAIEKILKNKNKFTNKEFVKKAEKIFNIKKTYKVYENFLKKLN